MDFFEKIKGKKILYQNEDQKKRIEEKLNKITCHNILNLNFLDHYFFFIFESPTENLIIRLYKLKYEFQSKKWCNEELNLMTSISINFDEPEDNDYNIDKIEKVEDFSNIDFVFYYPYDIPENETDFYNYQQYNLCLNNDEFNENTLKSQWGYKVNYKDIRWMMNLETIINSNYGVGEEFISQFRSHSFTKMNFIDIYYNKMLKESVIYKKIISSVSFVCDLCNSHFEDIENTKLWHNRLFGDLCDVCMHKKIKKEKFRKNLVKNKILNLGKKKKFEKELIKTKLFLANNKILELDPKKKQAIFKKVFNNTVSTLDKQYHNCSICLDNMEKDIYGGTCGHCFHHKCIMSLEKDECPLCRVNTTFFKLYLD